MKQDSPQPPRIRVVRSSTRKTGENYSKFEFGADAELAGRTYEDGFRALNMVVEKALNEAQKVAVTATEIQKPVGVTAAVTLHVPEPKLAPQPQAPILSEDPYLNLPFWRQSQKKSNLATFKISPDVLQNATVRELYEKLKLVKSLKVLGTSYRLSEYQGNDYLQKWSAVTVA